MKKKENAEGLFHFRIQQKWVSEKTPSYLLLHFTQKGLSWAKFSNTLPRNTAPLPQPYTEELTKYFRNKDTGIHRWRVDYDGYTPFQKRVLQLCKQIPLGKALSYGELASKSQAPRAARAVGSVMRRNQTPLIIPCHRVIRRGGELGRYSGGTGLKPILLNHEGWKGS